MPRRRSNKLWIPAVALALPAVAGGCCTSCGGNGRSGVGIDNCASIPPGAIPAPPGTYMRQYADLQAAKAEADDFVVYKHEWYMGGRELGPYGRYHVQLIAQRLPTVPFPVMVQAVPDATMNDARRQLVVRYLQQAGLADAEQRVIVGFPEAEGLYGEDAERIYNQLTGNDAGHQGTFGGANAPFSRNNYFNGGTRNSFRGGLGLGTVPF